MIGRYFAVDSAGEVEEFVLMPFGPRLIDAYRFTYLAMALAGTLELLAPSPRRFL